MTLDMLKKWEKELSNWGRWGKDDQRGLLNLVTPEKTRAAMALVKEAKTVTLQMNPIKKTGMDTGGYAAMPVAAVIPGTTSKAMPRG